MKKSEIENKRIDVKKLEVRFGLVQFVRGEEKRKLTSGAGGWRTSWENSGWWIW